MAQYPQIVVDQLSEIVEDRLYPLVGQFMGFFGFGFDRPTDRNCNTTDPTLTSNAKPVSSNGRQPDVAGSVPLTRNRIVTIEPNANGPCPTSPVADEDHRHQNQRQQQEWKQQNSTNDCRCGSKNCDRCNGNYEYPPSSSSYLCNSVPPTGSVSSNSNCSRSGSNPGTPPPRQTNSSTTTTTTPQNGGFLNGSPLVLSLRSRLMEIPSAIGNQFRATVTRDPNDRSAASNGVNTPAATGALRREPSTDSRAGNGNASSGLAASQSASGGSGTTGGGSGGLSSLSWGGSDNVVTSDDPLDASVPSSEKLGRLQFSISYEFDEQTLTLRIIRAVDLAAKDFGGTSDPYVKIMLLPDKKRKLQTNVKRKTLNPRWNEVFAFEGFPYNKLMNKTLFMQVMDYDRFSRDDPIGEVCIPLSDFDLVNGQTLWKNLQPCKGHAGKLGELHLSLCYHPAPGRITVTIHKARQLKAKDINGLSDPYVKIWLIHDGKKVEKKKTETKERTLDPVFETSFDFEVPYERIRQTSLIVSVMDYDRMGRNEQIGQIVLGSKSGPMEMKHWNEMFAKTRQAVSQWHVLKDFG